MKICGNCGCKLEDDARFCSSCGADVSAAPSVPTATDGQDGQNGFMSIFLKYASFMNDAQLYKVAVAKEMGVIQSAEGEVQEIYRVLAFRGHLDSMYRYAEFCLAGGDKLTAYKWFKVAADAGHIPSGARLQSENFSDVIPTKTVVAPADAKGAASVETAVTVSSEAVLENPNKVIEIPAGSGEFVNLVNEAMRGVVMITAIEMKGNVRMVSRGSGFIVDGLVITNAHVVGDNPSCIQANFEPTVDSRTYNVMPLTILKEYDIAVLKFTNLQPERSFKLRLSGVKFGESVYTIGNPLGVGLSVSKGIVSNPNRKNTFSGEYHSKLESVIQTDIVSNHGNSGGAILDMSNNVIAMLTFEPSKSEGGMSMCVPAEYIKNVIEKLNK